MHLLFTYKVGIIFRMVIFGIGCILVVGACGVVTVTCVRPRFKTQFLALVLALDFALFTGVKKF